MLHFWFGSTNVKVLPNEVWQYCAVLCTYLLKSILLSSVPILKMTSRRTDVNSVFFIITFIIIITSITFNRELIISNQIISTPIISNPIISNPNTSSPITSNPIISNPNTSTRSLLTRSLLTRSFLIWSFLLQSENLFWFLNIFIRIYF